MPRRLSSSCSITSRALARVHGCATSTHVGEWGPVLVIGVLAVMSVVPNLMTVPRLTDETAEAMIAVRIARGEELPLVNVRPYLGALFNYLVAAVLLVSGPTIAAGRIVTLVAATLTVAPTYLLGQSLSGSGARGKLVGLIAALLLASSATHAIVTGRVGYANSLTPLAITTGLWLLHRALMTGSGPSLVWAGLSFGLAAQAHPSSLSLLPGVALAALFTRPGLFLERRGQWTLLATGAGLLAIFNVIIANVQQPLAGLWDAQDRSEQYIGVAPWTVDAWTGRMLTLLRAYVLALGSRVSEQVEPYAVSAPLVLVVTALGLLGLASFTRRREWLPLLALISGLIVVGSLNGRVDPIVPRARHFASLLPLGLVVVAEGLVVLRDVTARAGRSNRTATVGLLTVVLLVAGESVWSRHAYEIDRLARPESNGRAFLAVLDAIAADGPRDERVYLDEDLDRERTLSGGRLLPHLHYALEVVGQEYATIDVDNDRLPIGRARNNSRRLVLDPGSLEDATKHYRLVPLAGDPGPGAPLRVFRAYPR